MFENLKVPGVSSKMFYIYAWKSKFVGKILNFDHVISVLNQICADIHFQI